MKRAQLPSIIAHRGASGYAPENTIAAIKKSVELNIDWVEFDVMLSGSGDLVIFHDETLNRTTNGSGKMVETSYQEIAKLDAGSWFSECFANQQVPTFVEMLRILDDDHLKAVIEIKPIQNEPDFETSRKTIQLIQKHCPQRLETSIFSSFDIDSLRFLNKTFPNLQLGLGLHEWVENWQALVEELDPISIHVNDEILTESRVALLKASGRHILSYTVNDPERAKALIAWGVDGFFSDYPDRLNRLTFPIPPSIQTTQR